MKTSTNPSGCLAAAIFGLLLVARLTATADNQYWNPTTTAKAAGSNDWFTSVGAWAPTSAGTTTPAPWVNGNDAWFNLNTGVNHATVNGVSAGLLYFQDGTFTFWPGTGPLTLAGPLTNINNLVTFNANVALSANQDWYVMRQTTVNGTLAGPYTLKKTGAGSPALVLSNANNNVAGIFVESGNLNAYAGGNVLGGATATLTLGSRYRDWSRRSRSTPLATSLKPRGPSARWSPTAMAKFPSSRTAQRPTTSPLDPWAGQTGASSAFARAPAISKSGRTSPSPTARKWLSTACCRPGSQPPPAATSWPTTAW